MRLIDEQCTKTPFYGSRKMTEQLKRLWHIVNRKRVVRLMEPMGLQAIYPRKNLSKPNLGHKVYPYLLRDLVIDRVKHGHYLHTSHKRFHVPERRY